MSDQEKRNSIGGDKKPKLPQVPKFNFYWIYGIVLVIFISVMLMPTDTAIKTTWYKVETDMIMSNDVEKIVVVNKDRANIFLKTEALKNER
jgi:cell division protease FtsH